MGGGLRYLMVAIRRLLLDKERDHIAYPCKNERAFSTIFWKPPVIFNGYLCIKMVWFVCYLSADDIIRYTGGQAKNYMENLDRNVSSRRIYEFIFLPSGCFPHIRCSLFRELQNWSKNSERMRRPYFSTLLSSSHTLIPPSHINPIPPPSLS